MSNDIGAAEAVLDLIVRSIVDDPDAVDIEASENENALRLDVRVGDGDMGRVIGKRGRMANAIRTVVAAAAATDGEEEVEVEFIDQ
ncbi:MAG: KH domain-containing protein [Acidimicrobiales bacterium]